MQCSKKPGRIYQQSNIVIKELRRGTLMSQDPTIECYDLHFAVYDSFQFAAIPQYATSLDITAMAIERYLDPNPIIIDLGCGTGNASAEILEKVPEAKFFLIDGSASMIDAAKKKLEMNSPGAVIGAHVADLSADRWHEDLPDCDAIVSTFVLEHLDFKSYRAVLERCHEVLRPGGWLIVVEAYVEEESNMLGWFEELMEGKKSLIEDSKLADFVSMLRSKHEVHYYCSKSQKASWWREAGFDNVHVIWQYLCLGLMAGQK
jgi:tRNA (cmo5U34)-methyltransferase